MDNQETKKLVKIIKTFYPHSFKTFSEFEYENLIRSYHSIFSDYAFDDLQEGLMSFIRTDSKGFPPAPAKIIQLSEQIKRDRKHNEEIKAKIEHDMNQYKNLTKEEKIKANEDWKIITGDSDAFIFEDV